MTSQIQPKRETVAPPSGGRRKSRIAIAWLTVAALTTLEPAPPAHAQNTQPHNDILGLVEMAAMGAASQQGLSGIEVRVRPLDQRLQPTLCDRELEIVRPNAGQVLGPVSYGVRCAGTVPWTLYLRAEVSAMADLPVLKRPLPRGAILSASDVEVTAHRLTTRASDLIIDPAMAVGMELKRPLARGSLLRYGHVTRPRLITRGQVVTLVAGTSGVEVRMQGKAMASGAEGDRLIVTNIRSGKRIEGLVLKDGSVRIP